MHTRGFREVARFVGLVTALGIVAFGLEVANPGMPASARASHADQHAIPAATRTNIYSGYSRVGYVSRSGSRINIYDGYSRVGYLSRA